MHVFFFIQQAADVWISLMAADEYGSSHECNEHAPEAYSPTNIIKYVYHNQHSVHYPIKHLFCYLKILLHLFLH